MHTVWSDGLGQGRSALTCLRKEDKSPYGDFEFPYIVGTLRALQFACCSLQILMIYCESGNIGFIPFIYYNTICVVYTLHIFRRWYLNIDGRFDLHQLIREPENTTKIQYSIALFTPTILSVLIYISVRLHNSFIKFVWTITCVFEMIMAIGLISLEFYEVFVLQN
ncbi:hypothetical protein Y032_0222g2628 [Ancylostoma ceylanicum]|uniref:DUF7087 domain-containing protein n=1 Tax=Ancylostoma ceylanicum TaxID=53326 RepID=A0A016SIV3_9BILA|nr:hypothetical protein Y032_0222g2628 [Ancylostoma ceylanicum]